MVSRNGAFALTVMLLVSSSAQSMRYLPSMPSLPSCASLKANAVDGAYFTAKVAAAIVAFEVVHSGACRVWNWARGNTPAKLAAVVKAYVPTVRSASQKQAALGGRVKALEEDNGRAYTAYSAVDVRLARLEGSVFPSANHTSRRPAAIDTTSTSNASAASAAVLNNALGNSQPATSNGTNNV